MDRTIEILAPAKNIETAKEAIKCGADAIYIASAGFGLRKGLDNSIEEIKELTDFAHKYWVKIYITVNTLIFSEEDFIKAKDLIQQLYEIEVDGIIVQDMGLLELDLPPIPLIASTNTCCFTPEIAKFMEEVGFSMIVLPRELTVDQIREIAKVTKIKLEAFCYGLLCVGYSGKCYLQYARNLKDTKGQESLSYYQYNAADNGKCNQTCMDFYNLLDANGNYIKKHERLLNLKFNNQAQNLPELFDAGVSSFKIEGRHKEISYVKNVVASFRQIADEIIKLRKLKKASSGRSILNFKPDLSKVFNKGYTDYFTHGRQKEMYSVDDIIGEIVGKAINYNNSAFELDTNIELSMGDKLRYRDKEGNIKSIHIEEVNGNKYTCINTEDNLQGLTLYRYFDANANEIIENAEVQRVISLEIKIDEQNESYEISIKDEDGNKAQVTYPKTQETTPKDSLYKLFDLVDENEFIIDKIDCEFENLQLNPKNLRNEIFSAIRAERAKNRPKITGGVTKNDYPYPEKITYLDNIVNEKAKQFYKRHGVEDIENGLETSKEISGKKILTGKYCIKYELGYCPKHCKGSIPTEPWFLEDCTNHKHKIVFDCQKCEMKILF